MDAIRNHRLLGGEMPPLWNRLEAFHCVQDRRPHYVLWQNALASVLGASRVLDRRGIVLGSEVALSHHSSHILAWGRDVLNLAKTPGWKKRPPHYVQTLMDSFYEPNGHRVAWMMVETCRDPIRSRHAGLTEKLLGDDAISYRHAALLLHTRRNQLSLEDSIRIPSRGIHFGLPEGRDERRARLVRTDIKRSLWLPGLPKSFGATIACYCIANPGEDDSDLAKGFVPCGLRRRQSSGINTARLITWFRMEPDTGYLENYTLDLDAKTGDLLSLRFQQANLRFAIEMDPWLDDWLNSALCHFSESPLIEY